MQQTHSSIKNTGQRGFTLIELMVSLSLFTIVVLAAIGSLYTVNSASRKVQAMRTSLDNLNFAIESMSRTIRTSTEIGCNGVPYAKCVDSPGQEITMRSTLGEAKAANPKIVRYQFCDGCNANGTSSIQKKEQGGEWVNLTSPEIDVKRMDFYVDGVCFPSGTSPDGSTSCDHDTAQPSVTMFIQGEATAGGTVAPFAIQTFVSQRTTE